MVSSAAITGIKQVFSGRAALVSNRESEEKSDLKLAGSPEAAAIQTTDAQAARAAGVSDVKAAQKLAENLSTAIISGVKVSQVVAGYSQEVAQSGDCSRPLSDLQTVTTLASERGEAMPLEKRSEKASELIAEIGIGSLIGAADRLPKSGNLIDGLEDLAKYLKDLTAPGREKAKQAVGAFLDDVFQPKGLTTNGFEMPIQKQQPENVLFMKGDEGLPQSIKPSKKVSLSDRVSDIGYNCLP